MKRIPAHVLISLALLFVFSLSGCVATSLYSVDMGYDAEKASIPAYLKPDAKALQSIIAVTEFADVRKIDDTLVIGRVTEKDGTRVLVLPKHVRPTFALASGVRQYLRKAGYNVSGVGPRWDLKTETIPQIGPGRLTIGGAIEEMEIDCRKAFPTNKYTTKMKLTLYLADSAEKKMLYKSTVEASTSKEHVSFSEERMGDQASIAIADAIEKMFEKKELAQKINEALNR